MPPRNRKPATIRATLPNAGIEREYQRRLEALTDEMANSARYWLLARYKEYLPQITAPAPAQAPAQAQDRSPSSALEQELNEVIRGWRKHFNKVSRSLARWFTKKVNGSATRSWSKALKDSGFAFEMKTSRRTQDVLQAIVKENVSLIKTIPEKYFGDVQQSVMRSVARGGDLGGLADELQEKYKLSRARAVTIAKDQNAKATQALTRSRNLDMNFPEGVWMHLSGAKVPRGTHKGVMNGKIFKIAEGLYDPDEGRKVFPSELIRCGCTYRPVVPVAGKELA